MWHNETMKFYKRLNAHFERGLEHGQQRIYAPGLIFGSLRQAYKIGYKEGKKMLRRRND